MDYKSTGGLSPGQWTHVMERGRCLLCNKPKVTTRLCRAHADVTIQAAKQKRAKRFAAGLCDRCGKPKGADGNKYNCRPCADLNSRYSSERSRRSNFGVSTSEYAAMLKRQKGKCAICKQPSKRTLAIDHCHKTGRVRQLLCAPCNWGLGHFQDDIERLRSAISYLQVNS